jgi:hypothetical protein
MDAHAYVGIVAAGSALVGLWVAVRLERFAPTTAKGAGLCFLLAWLCPGLIGPLFLTALLHMPVGLAILSTLFPVLVVTFTLAALALRYFAGLIGHTAR